MSNSALSARLIIWAHDGPMFARADLGRRIAPFSFGLVAVILPLFFIRLSNPTTFAIGAAVGGICVALAMLVPWHRLPKWVEIVPPVLGVVAIAFLRDGTGGHESGYSVLALLAVLWVALYGTPRQIGIIVFAVFLGLAVPIVAVGAPAYPAVEWRRLLVMVSLSAMIGWIVNSLVSAVRQEALGASDVARLLKEQTNLTLQVLESASDAVITVDDRGRIREFNPAATRLSGRPMADLIGADAMDVLLTPEVAKRARQALIDLVSGKRPPFGMDTEIIRPDGRPVPVEAWLSASGEPSARRVHIFARDITDRRLAEARATEHLADLEHILAAARTLSNSADVAESRHTICVTARAMADADVALYFERDPESGNVVSMASTAAMPANLVVDQQRSFVARHFDNREATFAPDLAADSRGDVDMARAVGLAAAYWQPVRNGEVLLGVLVLGWNAPNPVMDDRSRSLIEVLSTQVAGALARGQLLEQLQEMARTDSLTGLLNRRAMTEALDRDVAGSRRLKRPMSIAMMDLDHFKQFNDTFGHQAGDRLLVNAAQRWTAELRPMDTIARYGGEEFLVLLPGCDVATATVIADRLRAAVPERRTCSVGVAQWDGSETTASLIARADAALYAAKAAGRDITVAAGTAVGAGPTGTPAAEPARTRETDLPLAS
jgi:diguanylate cyclase (GGDEF)-like protein/PAS domain S-box-containing protein